MRDEQPLSVALFEDISLERWGAGGGPGLVLHVGGHHAHRPSDVARAAPAQRARAGRIQETTFLKPFDAGMLPRGRRAVRLEPPQPRAALDARRPLAARVGDGDGNVPNELRTRLCNGATPARWERRGHERGKRYGAGHVDVNDAGCSRCPWLADRAGELRAWRQPVAEIVAAWRLDDNGKRR